MTTVTLLLYCIVYVSEFTRVDCHCQRLCYFPSREHPNYISSHLRAEIQFVGRTGVGALKREWAISTQTPRDSK